MRLPFQRPPPHAGVVHSAKFTFFVHEYAPCNQSLEKLEKYETAQTANARCSLMKDDLSSVIGTEAFSTSNGESRASEGNRNRATRRFPPLPGSGCRCEYRFGRLAAVPSRNVLDPVQAQASDGKYYVKHNRPSHGHDGRTCSGIVQVREFKRGKDAYTKYRRKRFNFQ